MDSQAPDAITSEGGLQQKLQSGVGLRQPEPEKPLQVVIVERISGPLRGRIRQLVSRYTTEQPTLPGLEHVGEEDGDGKIPERIAAEARKAILTQLKGRNVDIVIEDGKFKFIGVIEHGDGEYDAGGFRRD